MIFHPYYKLIVMTSHADKKKARDKAEEKELRKKAESEEEQERTNKKAEDDEEEERELEEDMDTEDEYDDSSLPD
jgi:hypothetical protein